MKFIDLILDYLSRQVNLNFDMSNLTSDLIKYLALFLSSLTGSSMILLRKLCYSGSEFISTVDTVNVTDFINDELDFNLVSLYNKDDNKTDLERIELLCV